MVVNQTTTKKVIELSSKVKVIEGYNNDDVPFDLLFAANKPVLLKGLVKQWPLVQASKDNGHTAVVDLLSQNDSGQPFIVYKGDYSIKAKFGYNSTCTGFNYISERSNFEKVTTHVNSQLSTDKHDYMYVNSLALKHGFPALAKSHTLNFKHDEFAGNQPLAKIWLGTESIAAAHFDIPKNIACCVHGKRRFTLFSPDQVDNLYPGPLTPTPGGQVVTMADLNKPDFNKYPKLQTALENAYVVDMEPGDALYYPSMWWHQVEAFDRWNVMINFWWMGAPAFLGNPMDVLSHGMMSLRDRPEHEKAAWKALFDYYVFGDSEQVTAHLPEQCQGALAPMDNNLARRMRATLLNNLNR